MSLRGRYKKKKEIHIGKEGREDKKGGEEVTYEEVWVRIRIAKPREVRDVLLPLDPPCCGGHANRHIGKMSCQIERLQIKKSDKKNRDVEREKEGKRERERGEDVPRVRPCCGIKSRGKRGKRG